MGIIEAIILGVIQGLTEFLPVSSSGHLEIGKALLGAEGLPEESLMFTVAVHFATSASTVVVFRKEIVQILRGLLQFRWNEEMIFSVKIVLSMIPAAAIGILFIEEIEALFSGQTMLVGFMLIVTGLLLFVADRSKNTGKQVTYSNAILLGISQAIAIMPGISRSGATISTAVLLGVDRTQAARFSFLMVVPLIFGKIAKDVLDGSVGAMDTEIAPIAAGTLAAFFAGLIACRWMITLVRQSHLSWFSYYCFGVGTLTIALSALLI